MSQATFAVRRPIGLRPKVSREALMSAFITRSIVTLTGFNFIPVTGVISSLEHEDGSGHSYIVVISGQRVYIPTF